MKSKLIIFYVLTILVVLSSCTDENIAIDSDALVQQKEEKLFIEGIEHVFTFKESNSGEITVNKSAEELIDKFVLENENMSFYFDKNDILHIFKNSMDMKFFMETEAKSYLKSIEYNKDIRTKSSNNISLVSIVS